ncbi:unnamed protein product [Acanthoscelides obtectus]|uniref:Uncharacterized protein n=1 Tax=Acanthoscelides obtectus TaxID=200917 RepID=A0A9P0KTP5_ACAOB|nr:unnamed protein product [Acanthoscelides obtectus]CAK1660659.1 hypothetical protein AOBTE_LOCUS22206 [Acanthoscelides obtectus]
MALPRALCRVRCLFINDISVFPKYTVLINSGPVNKYVRLQLTRDFRTNISSVVRNMKEHSKDQDMDTGSSSTSDTDSTDSDSDEEDVP